VLMKGRGRLGIGPFLTAQVDSVRHGEQPGNRIGEGQGRRAISGLVCS